MASKNSIHVYECIEHRTANAALAQAILGLSDDMFERRSHFFHGRYENLYLDATKLPTLRDVLETGVSKSAALLQCPVESIKLGFWLNIMNKGDITTLHSHDDEDELLSAVYYIQVPPGSGVFKWHAADKVEMIEPVAGCFMFFDPAIPHEVSEHRNEIPRISIGINIGPAYNAVSKDNGI